MRGGESRPVSPQEYGVLLMGAFVGVEYEEEVPLEDTGELIEVGIHIMGAKKRSKSAADPQGSARWTGVEVVATSEQFGNLGPTRIVVMKKKTDAGQVDIMLFSDMERVGVIRTDYELPSDFSPQDEFKKGLQALAGTE